ncbi:MAG TPA: HlyD family efflux transporter periplasmic adaptor subunit [Steroidobacteraceae bacterium]|jgi:membrane fusion protein (multidrug efflux system)|nr:HlyD family efflux transporter periplasmic adaptor subunit [Steroidobacteraceae bacterium]
MNANTQSLTADPANGKRRRILLIIALVFICIGALCAAYWVLVLSKREKTDDAYVNGNKVTISAQVAGTVVAVLADDTQLVKAGQVLVKLDPIDAETALSRSANALAQTVRQVRQQKATADQYDSVIETRKLELARAETDLAKREPLLSDRAIPAEEVRHARESVAIARAALTQAERQSKSAHALVDGTLVESNPAVLQARDVYRDAWISAQRNAVVAPVTGYVAERSVQLGQHIQAGQALMSVIPLNSLWVDANFKEAQLRNLRIGQKAEVRSDLYGGSYIYHGRVEGMSAGTGAAFSLLPPQNASGNWIKVVQRVPVRIQIDDGDLAKSPLRVGLSATVTVDTTSRNGAVLAMDTNDNTVGDTQVYTQDLAKANAEADAIVRRNLGVDH